jgi:hypothetical protein
MDKKIILDKGKLKRVSDSHEVDYHVPSGSDFLSAASNLIPGVGGVSGGRVLLGDKASVQAISLINRETPLVQSIPKKGSKSFEEHLGHTLAALKSTHTGEITHISDDEIHIKDDNNKNHVVELYNNFNSGRKSFLHHTAAVKVGDKIKKGDLLASSNFTDKQGNLALGVNLNTAIMPYRSNNFEDAFVVTETGAKKLQAEQLINHKLEKKLGVDTNKNKFISLFPNKFYNNQLQTMDEHGVVKPGTVLNYGDPLILAFAPKGVKATDIALGKLSKALSQAHKDATETWDYENPGVVTDVSNKHGLISVNVKTVRPLNVGDKLSIYSGNKGVTGLILPDIQAPTDKDGKPVDLILNSMSITSRVSPALLTNLALGKVAKKMGKPMKITPFVEGSAVEKTQELLKKHGLTDVEKLHDPVTGNSVEALVGPLFINRLVHIAEDKVSNRAQGVGYDWDMQPAKAKDESAKRLGNLSTTALLSHGVTSVLRDIATVRATKNDEFWRNIKLGLPAPAPKVPFIFDKFIASMEGAGIKVKRDDNKFQLLPQTDKDILAKSSGPIENPKTFKVKGSELTPEKGGLFDPTLTGLLSDKLNHINLHYAIPNPVTEDPMRRLLKFTKQKFEEAIADGSIHKLITNIDVNKSIATCKEYLKSGKVSERDNSVKVLAFLNTLKANNLHPKDLLISKVPVIPAKYRPIQIAGDMTLSANANHLYKDLMLNNNSIPTAEKLGNKEILDKSRLEQYRAVKAVYGLGDPISTKNQEKNVKGLLAEMLGTHGGSAKGSVFQAKVVNKPLDLVGRGVASGDAKLDLDEISIPHDIAWKVFSPFLIRRLVRRGIPATQATDYVKNRNPLAVQALTDEMKDRPVILSRDPALHKFNLMGFMTKLNADPKNKTLVVNPLLFKGFTLDLDGDQTNISAPANDDAKEEIKEKMLPSKNLLSVRSFSPMFVPSNESALGLYQLSTEDKKNKPLEFNSEEDALKAFHNGQAHPGDRIVIKK